MFYSTLRGFILVFDHHKVADPALSGCRDPLAVTGPLPEPFSEPGPE